MSISRLYKIINDVDELIYIGSTTCQLSKRMAQHRRDMRKANRTSKLYDHMRTNGVEHYKILLIKEYTDISKDRLQKREHKYIKRYDSVKNGLNTYEMGGYSCIHNMMKRYCMSCNGSSMCSHGKIKRTCVECKGSAMCIHEKEKGKCKICSPSRCDRCGKTYAGKQSLRTHQIKCQINQSNITE